jgi:hypothetical protein
MAPVSTGRSHRRVGRDGEDDDRIMVGAHRPSTRVRRADDRPGGTWAGDAGLTLIAIIAVVAVVGALIGRLFDATAAGALVGGFFGVVAGFAGVYRRYRAL